MSPFFAAALLCVSVAGSGLLVTMTFRGVKQPGSVPLLLSAVTFLLAFVIGSFLATGYVELLGGMAAVSTTGAAVAALLGFIAIALCSPEVRRQPLRSAGEGCLQVLAALKAALGAVARAQPRALVVSAVTLLAALAVSSFIMGFPRGTESIAYHLPNGLTALQTGSLRIADGIFYSAHPANDGIWYAFLLSLLPERFAALGQLPFLPALVLAVYGIARITGADARGSTVAAIGILSIPVITLAATLAESDVVGATFVAIALYFVLASGLPRARYLIAGLAVGLAFGFKSLHLIAGGLLVAVVIFEPWWRRTGEQSVEREPWYAATGAFLAAALLMASFWVLRNYLETGNPIYPVYVKTVFDALGWPAARDIDYDEFRAGQFVWVRSVREWVVYPWIEWHYADAGTHYKSNAGMGAFFAAAVPVAWLYTSAESILQVTRGETQDGLKRRFVLLLGGTLLIAMWYLLGGRAPTYSLAAWVFLFPLVGFTIASVHGKARPVMEWLLAACILWMFFSFVTQELVTFGDRIIYSRHFSRDKYYEYPSAVDRLPAGATIVNLADRESNYPLAGSGHGNRVIKFEWSLRTFGIDAKSTGYKLSIEENTKGIALDTATLRRFGATHVYTRTNVEIGHDACVQLRELGRLDRNPVSGARLDPAKVLYEIEYCKAPS